MARSGRLRTGFCVALLLVAACGVLVWEPWHGPTVLSLTAAHGLDTGDLPAVALLAFAIAVLLARERERSTGPRRGRWVGPASGAALGVLLLSAGVLTHSGGGSLVPSGGGTFGGSTQHASAHKADPVQRWSHVAVTYDGARLRLYDDGREVSSRATTGTISRTPNPLWIGGNRPYGEYFRGVIDEVRVYDRVLGPHELRAEMSTPIGLRGGSPGSGLVGAYAFDRRSKTVAADASGNGNAGMITGATWTPDGRFGGALRFDGARETVRVPNSRSLDLKRGMTLAAWIRPTQWQTGWRTILHRQTDVYFLTVGSAKDVRAGAFDDLRLALVVGAAVWLGLMLGGGRAGWLGGARRSWWPPVVLFLAGSLVDAAVAPSPTLVGPTLVTIWCALTAPRRREAVVLYLLAAAFTALTAVSLGGPDLATQDGGVARSAALGLLLITLAVLGLRRGEMGRASSSSLYERA
jgi:hypothetical protein